MYEDLKRRFDIEKVSRIMGVGRVKEFSVYIENSKPLNQKLNDGLGHIQWRQIIRTDDHVFLKPNFTFPSYRYGVTTSPCLLEALLGILKNRASEITIIESNGGNNVFTADEAFRGHGIPKLCKEFGIDAVNLSDCPSTKAKDKIGSRTVEVSVPRFLPNEVDCFVCVPVLKVHAMTLVSLGIKNLWGCHPNPMRCLYHEDIDKKLALLTKLWNPRICIIDGTYALDGHGPMFGQPVEMNLLIVGNNVVASDSVGASVMGFDPHHIKHIRVASEEKLGPIDLRSIRVNTDWRRFCRVFSFKRTPLDYLSLVPFHSELLAKIIFNSPFTSGIRRMVDIIRTSDEKEDLRGYVN